MSVFHFHSRKFILQYKSPNSNHVSQHFTDFLHPRCLIRPWKRCRGVYKTVHHRTPADKLTGLSKISTNVYFHFGQIAELL